MFSILVKNGPIGSHLPRVNGFLLGPFITCTDTSSQLCIEIVEKEKILVTKIMQKDQELNLIVTFRMKDMALEKNQGCKMSFQPTLRIIFCEIN